VLQKKSFWKFFTQKKRNLKGKKKIIVVNKKRSPKNNSAPTNLRSVF
jgi:hypothetical protein